MFFLLTDCPHVRQNRACDKNKAWQQYNAAVNQLGFASAIAQDADATVSVSCDDAAKFIVSTF